MGLADLIDDDNRRHPDRHYPDHEWDDKLYSWAEEMESKFPGGVEYAFIEVSPEMTKTDGFAYYRGEHGFIRISEPAIERCPEYRIKMILLHEMTHLWFYQNGYREYSDGSGIFEWALGRVGADINGIGPRHEEWDIIKDFLNHSENQQ